MSFYKKIYQHFLEIKPEAHKKILFVIYLLKLFLKMKTFKHFAEIYSSF